jgi:hypothetical protein
MIAMEYSPREKMALPNFTKTQIDNYKSSALANPEEHAP